MTTETGRLSGAIYNAAGTQLGLLPVVISAQITDRVNRAGSCTFSAPSYSPGASLLTDAYEVRITRAGDGLIFRGVIATVEDAWLDGPIKVVSCDSPSVELGWRQTVFGVPLYQIAATTAVDHMLLGTGWTKLDSLTSPRTISDQFINQTRYRGLLRIAEIQGGYIRETSTYRQIEIKNTTSASGIRLLNVEYATPQLSNNASVGFIKSMKRTREKAIINRIIPVGEANNDVVLDMQELTDAEPHPDYTVKVLNSSSHPRLMYINIGFFGAGTQEPSLPVSVAGRNRLLVVINSLNGVGASHATKYNGATLWKAHVFSGTNHEISVAYLPAPEIRSDGIVSVRYDAPPATSGAIIALVFENVHSVFPFNGTATAQATSSTPSATHPGVNPLAAPGNALIIDFLNRGAAASATPDASQTFITRAGQLEISQKILGTNPANNPTMSWTLSSSVAWTQFLLCILPQYSYYIEDVTSQTAHGVREDRPILKANRYLGVDSTGRQTGAEMLYWMSIDKLLKHKDPVDFYELEIEGLSNTSWLPGDSVRLDYSEAEFSVNEDVVCLERTREYDEDGYLSWKLTLAPVYRYPRTTMEIISGQFNEVDDLEAL